MAQSGASTMGETTQHTITANVGHGFGKTKEVPSEIGEFTVWDCPNNDSVTYERDYTPTDEMVMPAIREKFRVTTQESGQWDVTRSVETREAGSGRNIRTGEAYDTVVTDLQTYEPVGVGFDTFEGALEHLDRLAEAASVTDSPPKDVKQTVNPWHKAFREIRLEQ
ncbi:hypothetical protein HLRTI_002890 [Halorhabdus tiamatea SARL4B]|uniref:Uncharacterized protein n=1 Tax=Halorhabdus tiamatea SARL4B TaxID=1033806 RepID=U2DZ78_9EURY|nr:hypothetical protein [Halorhabdus tiamatea]ERJ05091.1 hypothetical protein HLRTI_002890 [Halorhabdus tiamatea SARL4B]